MHELPKLPYAYGALEPAIDAETMELHHGKHHATYVAKLNEALAKFPEYEAKPLEDLLKSIDALPIQIRSAVKNHGGGHHNHSLFWQMLRPARENNAPEGELLAGIMKAFGTFDAFKEQFSKEAAGLFGSGWCWLALSERSESNGLATISQLVILTTPNQNSLLMQGFIPVLGLDVWEHAYYLKHRNRRADYVAGFWNIVNWERCEQLHSEK